MEWIVNTDPVQTHPNDDQFIPRYSAATFYFATSSSSLWSNCGSDPSTSPCVNVVTSRIFDRPRSNNIPPSRFLSSSHVCHWFGITCNDEDQITVINIRKWKWNFIYHSNITIKKWNNFMLTQIMISIYEKI